MIRSRVWVAALAGGPPVAAVLGDLVMSSELPPRWRVPGGRVRPAVRGGYDRPGTAVPRHPALRVAERSLACFECGVSGGFRPEHETCRPWDRHRGGDGRVVG